jgi:cell division protein ZapA
VSDDREVLTLRILDKEYRVSCPPEERESLIAAARELNERMRDMRDSAKVLGAERMAVMAALNVIHEREQIASRQFGVLDSAREAVDRLESKLDAAIGRRDSTQPLDS